MRNPIFASYVFNPGINGEYNRYEDALDKLRKSYHIDYGIAPTYSDVNIQRLYFMFPETFEGELSTILGLE